MGWQTKGLEWQDLICRICYQLKDLLIHLEIKYDQPEIEKMGMKK
jgi:hypothetical protein